MPLRLALAAAAALLLAASAPSAAASAPGAPQAPGAAPGAPGALLAQDDADDGDAGGLYDDSDLFGDDLYGDDFDSDALFGDGGDDAPVGGAGDPLEFLNRPIYALNSGFDRVIFEPAAKTWGLLVPDPLDEALGNFISNLELPLTAFNAVLQGDPEGAASTFARFAVNSSAGILGFGDPATGLGLPRCDEDLGQTLTRWGVGSGPYLMLPLFGPSSLRDVSGGLVEAALLPDPEEEIMHGIGDILGFSEQGEDNVLWSLALVEALQFRLEIDEGIQYVRDNSLDEYAFLRSFYRQNGESEAGTTCGDLLEEMRRDRAAAALAAPPAAG